MTSYSQALIITVALHTRLSLDYQGATPQRKRDQVDALNLVKLTFQGVHICAA